MSRCPHWAALQKLGVNEAMRQQVTAPDRLGARFGAVLVHYCAECDCSHVAVIAKDPYSFRAADALHSALIHVCEFLEGKSDESKSSNQKNIPSN